MGQRPARRASAAPRRDTRRASQTVLNRATTSPLDEPCTTSFRPCARRLSVRSGERQVGPCPARDESSQRVKRPEATATPYRVRVPVEPLQALLMSLTNQP